MARLHAAPLIPTSLPTGWSALIARMTVQEATDRPTAADAALVLASVAQQPAARDATRP